MPIIINILFFVRQHIYIKKRKEKKRIELKKKKTPIKY